MSSPSSDEFPSRLPQGWYTNVNAEWPLKFQGHYFSVSTYSTYGCRVLYAGMQRVDDAEDELQGSSERLGDMYPNNMTATMGPIPNFPPPAKVTWRSRDGTAHEADIDIGEIFKDQRIRHNVAREDASEPATDGITEIILEVNDRTINVYTRTNIWLKKPRFPDQPLSNYRGDLIKVFSQTY